MSAKSMHEAKEMLCKELEDLTRKGSISRSDLEPIEQLTTSIKNLMKINEMEEGGYSYGMGEWNAKGGYSNNGGYSNRGYSGDNMGMSNAGYSNERYSRGSYGDGDDTMSGRMHYVRGHYSRAGEDMVTERIEEMMNDSHLSVDDKSTLRRAMDILRK